MKKWRFLLSLCIGLCLLSACGAASGGGESPAPPSDASLSQEPEAPSLAEDETPALLLCRIVDGAEEGTLLLAELDEGQYRGSGVYSLPVGNIPVTLDGQPADASALEDGMPVELAFNGMVLESFPAQLGEVYSIAAWSRGQGENSTETCYDLCGLYLQVLEDLWQKDPALNENITRLALDLSQAPGGLTESEQAALVWRFGALHGMEAIAASFAELKEDGTLTASVLRYTVDGLEPYGGTEAGPAFYEWKDGCLFTIRASEGHEEEAVSLPAICFDAEKWRSSLAAYIFQSCSAVWAEAGTWSGYRIGGEMIS